MKLTKFILLLLLCLLIIPIFSIIILSFQHTEGNVFKWYQSIFNDESFLSAFSLSFFISILSAILNLVLSFILSLSWFKKVQTFVVLVLIILLGLLPPDVLALSINKISQLLSLYDSNLLFLVLALCLYTLPIGILMLWARYYFIDDTIFFAAKDIGLKSKSVILKIILPLSKNNLISVFLLSFLLSFNEYSRSFYLSGAHTLLSEFLNGKLNSGADNSIYAGASSTIIMTSVLVVGYFLFNSLKAYRRLNTI